jgi:general nucleoside transport system permease protein
MDISTLVSSMLRLGVPLLIGGMGVLVTAKSGIVNLGMEGNMLLGAFAAVYGTYITGSPILGLCMAVLAGILFSMLFGLFIISGRGNQVVVGLGLNFFSTGLTFVLLKVIWGTAAWSPEVQMLPQMDLPWLGKQSISLIIALVAFLGVWVFLYKTNIGFRIRSVGENPTAADSVGVNVAKYQYIALLVAGILGGLAGAETSIGQIGLFMKNMTNGKGYVAMASVIISGYTPLGVMLSTMFLSFFDALQMRMQFLFNIPGQFLLSLPYVVTLIALIGVNDVNKPKASGKTYVRGNF